MRSILGRDPSSIHHPTSVKSTVKLAVCKTVNRTPVVKIIKPAFLFYHFKTAQTQLWNIMTLWTDVVKLISKDLQPVTNCGPSFGVEPLQSWGELQRSVREDVTSTFVSVRLSLFQLSFVTSRQKKRTGDHKLIFSYSSIHPSQASTQPIPLINPELMLHSIWLLPTKTRTKTPEKHKEMCETFLLFRRLGVIWKLWWDHC